ncbi:GNAT family N-acetyltransferase [Actinomadura fulvescens]|uniref:N-acetyltransferase domain-containing protein n=1 Tax=Actinomadura fulvescens TaxID=46160 RepID=A0ABN3Q6W5_9ACTN
MADLELSFRRYDRIGAREQRDLIVGIYTDAYADAVNSADPFETVDAFLTRFDAYTRHDGFDLVIAYHGEEPMGQTFGWPLSPPDGGWWRYLTAEVEPGWTHETGRRTFALSEIMVCRAWTGRGVARALHDELLGGRRETRAVLLVRPDNENAYRAYRRWGWSKISRLRGGWEDAPLFDVLTIDLPLAPKSVRVEGK